MIPKLSKKSLDPGLIGKHIYLGGPYTSKHETTENWRETMLTMAAGILIEYGFLVYSPITHCAPIRRLCGMDGSWTTWASHNDWLIRGCSTIIILGLDGWQDSAGVNRELFLAQLYNKKRYLLPPEIIFSQGNQNESSM